MDRAPGYEPGGLEVRTLSGAMFIQPFASGPVATNAYVVACKSSGKAAIIDPSPGSFESIKLFLKNNTYLPEKILITHSHWDHIADVSKFKREYAIPVWIHALDAPNLANPGADGLQVRIPIEGVAADYLFKEGDTFSIGEIEFDVIHTPGHSPGGVCFYSAQNKVLISGDTLFRGSFGILSLPTAQPDLMWQSLARLWLLPKDTTVYPGHGPYTTIGRESWLPEAKKFSEF